MPDAPLGSPDDTPFGAELTGAAVAALKIRQWQGELYALARMHRDYCGHGLFWERAAGRYHVSAALDGLPQGAPRISFSDEAAFTDWLARQSDLSLSGHVSPNVFEHDSHPGNQRITRAFLLDQIAHAR